MTLLANENEVYKLDKLKSLMIKLIQFSKYQDQRYEEAINPKKLLGTFSLSLCHEHRYFYLG